MAISPQEVRKQRLAQLDVKASSTNDWSDSEKLSGKDYHNKRRKAQDELYNEQRQ